MTLVRASISNEYGHSHCSFSPKERECTSISMITHIRFRVNSTYNMAPAYGEMGILLSSYNATTSRFLVLLHTSVDKHFKPAAPSRSSTPSTPFQSYPSLSTPSSAQPARLHHISTVLGRGANRANRGCCLHWLA